MTASIAAVVGLWWYVRAYVLFGRDRKAFSKQSRLLRQDPGGNALPLLSSILSRQDVEIARLEDRITPDIIA